MSRRAAKVTQANIDRLAALARALGLEIAAIEATADKVRLVTTAGVNLTTTDDEALLDRELAEHRARHGNA